MLKAIFVALTLAALPSITFAASYCGTVRDNRLVDGSFNPYFSESDLANLAPSKRELVTEGNCICLIGAIEEQNDPAADPASGERWYNQFSRLTNARQSSGCTN